MSPASALAQRVIKNARHLKKWARREELTAYRIYDRDIPEFPYAIDWYDGWLHWAAYPRRSARKAQLELTRDSEEVTAVSAALGVPVAQIFIKTHAPHAWGETQYERLSRQGVELTVNEGGLKFWVNLSDFLDTGLFLDHRETRARVRSEARGKRFLNLFAYTASFTIHAAAGGALDTTTVDLSSRYLEWGQRNLEANGLSDRRHRFVRADALQWLSDAQGRERYDLIVLDPPSFSSSKAMTRRFEVQRDQVKLLDQSLGLLRPGGILYFSTNFLGFEPRFTTEAQELTPGSIPPDFRVKSIHRCWRFVAAPS